MLQVPKIVVQGLAPYVPSGTTPKPHVTLTYAASLDSCIAAAPGIQTKLSGLQSKAMTHYLRSQHDAVLVGVGTVLADDPALNCRLEGVAKESQPRPVIVDPSARWGATPSSRILQMAKCGKGLAPWVITDARNSINVDRVDLLESFGGQYLALMDCQGRLEWSSIFRCLVDKGVRSVMVEGGAVVIDNLLQQSHLLSAIIVTIAPVYLGRDGVSVSPPSSVKHLTHVTWQVLGQDSVMCGLCY